MSRRCNYCGKDIEYGEYKKQKYCNNACRQANHRAKNKEVVKVDGVEVTGYEKGLAVKREHERTRYCKTCGMGFIVTGAQGKKMYCSNACRQAYYQKWAKLRATWETDKKTPQPLPTAVDPNETLKEILAKLEQETSI